MIAISTTLWIGKAGAGANTSDASELFRHVVHIQQYHVLKRTILLQDMKKRLHYWRSVRAWAMVDDEQTLRNQRCDNECSIDPRWRGVRRSYREYWEGVLLLLSSFALWFVPQPLAATKASIGSLILIINGAFTTEIHAHIVQALIATTYPDSLAKIAASQMRSTHFVGIKNKIALLAVVKRSFKV
jgi:hypothetical protein